MSVLPATPTFLPYTCGDDDCADREDSARRCPSCWGGFPLGLARGVSYAYVLPEMRDLREEAAYARYAGGVGASYPGLSASQPLLIRASRVGRLVYRGVT